jgi:hypothetical protein
LALIQWGPNGEAILGRSAESYEYDGIIILDGLVLLTRENKGVGEWTITPVPYPAEYSHDAGYEMVFARMATSGDNHQYIHIVSHIQLHAYFFFNAVLYQRTQNGGLTWDVEGEIVPEMLGEEWDQHSQDSWYPDLITIDTRNNVVACAFSALGYNGYVIKSHDNGNTWTSIKFFDTPVGPYISPAQYADTCFIPTQGCIALDNNGKIHVAFSVVLAMNVEDEGYITVFPTGVLTSFLSYWNEDMVPITTEYAKHKIEPLLMEYFDWEQSDVEAGKYCLKPTAPKFPVIGYFSSEVDGQCFTIPSPAFFSWHSCYGERSIFSFPQMGFDKDNTLHLAYIGVSTRLIGEQQESWIRHPFYTTYREDTDTWTQTKHLVSSRGQNVVDGTS